MLFLLSLRAANLTTSCHLLEVSCSRPRSLSATAPKRPNHSTTPKSSALSLEAPAFNTNLCRVWRSTPREFVGVAMIVAGGGDYQYSWGKLLYLVHVGHLLELNPHHAILPAYFLRFRCFPGPNQSSMKISLPIEKNANRAVQSTSVHVFVGEKRD